MLTGSRIIEEVQNGKIIINPFNERQINPNSYNLRLDNRLLIYKKQRHAHRGEHHEYWLDMAEEEPTIPLDIGPMGMVLYPGVLYLGSTFEAAGSDWYIPFIEGRSSVGRLGVSTHITAGLGDLGFKGTWTLEISVVAPIRVYSGIEICQICFLEPHGVIGDRLYKGKYSGQNRNSGPKASSLWKELRKDY